MRWALVLLLVVGSAALAGVSAAARGTTEALTFFQTPSKNIGCIYSPALGNDERPYLRCDIGSGLRPLPRRPKSCDLDWGYGYSMLGTGKAKPFCAGDTARISRAPVLRYGKTWKRGPFTCHSRITGLRCLNRSKHGFFLSRARSYTF